MTSDMNIEMTRLTKGFFAKSTVVRSDTKMSPLMSFPRSYTFVKVKFSNNNDKNNCDPMFLIFNFTNNCNFADFLFAISKLNLEKTFEQIPQVSRSMPNEFSA